MSSGKLFCRFEAHFDLLWARIFKRPSGASDETALGAEMTEPEIHHNGFAVIVHEDVGPFQVFVTHAEEMERVDGVAETAEEGDGLVDFPRLIQGGDGFFV